MQKKDIRCNCRDMSSAARLCSGPMGGSECSRDQAVLAVSCQGMFCCTSNHTPYGGIPQHNDASIVSASLVL